MTNNLHLSCIWHQFSTTDTVEKLKQVFVGQVVAMKETSRILKEIGKIWPLSGKHHLKRVRRTSVQGMYEIIICAVSDVKDREAGSLSCLKDLMSGTEIDTNGLSDVLKTLPVPKCQPYTRSQFEACSKLWPVKFREDQYIERMLSGALFADEERKKITEYMLLALKAASDGEDLQVGAVVVDQATDEVVAVAHDHRHQHPLQHAVMVAIDLVAKSQGCGVWPLTCKKLFNKKYEEAKQSSSPARENEQSNSNGVTENGSKNQALPYLCTSYYMFVTREPCCMCSMALVHSRIRRLFYCNPLPTGALGSTLKMHVCPALNHRFEVWQCTFDEQG